MGFTTFEEIIKFAVKREDTAYRLYKTAAERAQSIAARKMFQKAVTDDPGAFDEQNPDQEEPPPIAESSRKLKEMAEFRDEAKAAREFVQKLARERNITLPRAAEMFSETATHHHAPAKHAAKKGAGATEVLEVLLCLAHLVPKRNGLANGVDLREHADRERAVAVDHRLLDRADRAAVSRL